MGASAYGWGTVSRRCGGGAHRNGACRLQRIRRTKKNAVTTDPNAYPATYRSQIATFLRQSLTNRADFRGALISQPVLMPIGDNQRYAVCVQFHGNGQIKNKVAIYFAGMIAQFINSTPEQSARQATVPRWLTWIATF